MFDRRLLQNFEWRLLALCFTLGVLGLIALYSAVSAGSPAPQTALFYKQLVWFGIGSVLMILAFALNYKILDKLANFIYVGCIAMLGAVLVMGKYAGGSRRWLLLGPVSVQPSELIKLVLIIVLARYYSKLTKTNGYTLRELIFPAFAVLLPCALIVKQPDLGTAMLLILIAGSVTLFVKIERRSFWILISGATVLAPLVWFFLKGYQKQRILTFLNPDRDPLGAGYHIIQSKIAIGSGMLSGKGFQHGTQNVLSFLPEHHTDFIFSVFAEEWGFAGSVVLLAGFMILIIWGLSIAYRCRDPFGVILSFGITAMIFWQAFINMGMVMGLMPVVGVPLPLISYGGSSVVTNMISIGLLMNISMRRYMFDS